MDPFALEQGEESSISATTDSFTREDEWELIAPEGVDVKTFKSRATQPQPMAEPQDKIIQPTKRSQAVLGDFDYEGEGCSFSLSPLTQSKSVAAESDDLEKKDDIDEFLEEIVAGVKAFYRDIFG